MSSEHTARARFEQGLRGAAIRLQQGLQRVLDGEVATPLAASDVPADLRVFYPPPMRLPRPNKTAFDARELYAQQRDPRTHCTALQQLLHVLLRYLQTTCDLPNLQLTDLDFTANFGAPATESQRTYLFSVTRPVTLAVQALCTIDAEMVQRWAVGSPGDTTVLATNGAGVTAQVSYTPPSRPPEQLGREQRHIEVD